jgi:hypothetical protein
MNNDRQKKEARTANSSYPKVAVQWLNQALQNVIQTNP